VKLSGSTEKVTRAMSSEPKQIGDKKLVIAQTGSIGMLSYTSFTAYMSLCVCVCSN